MKLWEKFKEYSSLKYGIGAVAGAGITVSALAAGGGLDVNNLLGYNQPSMSFDSVLADHMDPTGRNFESRYGQDDNFEQALFEVSNRAGGVYLIYDPNNETEAQIVMPTERSKMLPDLSGYVQFNAYSDAITEIIAQDRADLVRDNNDIVRINSYSDKINLPLDDPNGVRVVQLLGNSDHGLGGLTDKDYGAVGFKTLARVFGEQVGAYDGHTIYRLESSELGFACNLIMNDQTGNLMGQDCDSSMGKIKEEQIMARIDASLKR